jgi:IS30 family transposase
MIRKTWSPEQIVAGLEGEQGVCISQERICQYLYADKRSGGDQYRSLRCQKPRRKRYSAYDRRGDISRRVSINELPAIVDARWRAVTGKATP